MINFFKEMFNVKFYIDPYMEDNKILRGGYGENGTYFVVNEKTSNIVYKSYKKGLRIKKLENILNEINRNE